MASPVTTVHGTLYHGEIEKRLDTSRNRSYYRYLIKSDSDEVLFDGAAGDIQEASESIKAYVRFLCSTQPR